MNNRKGSRLNPVETYVKIKIRIKIMSLQARKICQKDMVHKTNEKYNLIFQNRLKKIDDRKEGHK